MEDKIILRNPQKFDIGIITLEKPLGVNIKAGSFALVSESELNYLASTSNLLQKGLLQVDDKHKEQMLELGINPDEDVNFVTNEEIQKKLSGTGKKLREWLATIEEGHTLDRVYDVAQSMNLNMDKVKILKEKMPDKEFLD